MTFILLLIPVTLFLIGFFIFGTEKNILLIFSMVMVIPFAMGVTGTVAVFLQKSIPEDVYQRIREHEGSLTMAYELYVTNEKASTMLDRRSAEKISSPMFPMRRRIRPSRRITSNVPCGRQDTGWT